MKINSKVWYPIRNDKGGSLQYTVLFFNNGGDVIIEQVGNRSNKLQVKKSELEPVEEQETGSYTVFTAIRHYDEEGTETVLEERVLTVEDSQDYRLGKLGEVVTAIITNHEYRDEPGTDDEAEGNGFRRDQ